MTETSTDFIGFANYAQFIRGHAPVEALLHTVIFTLIALPLELLLGLAMAQFVPGKLPGRQIFVALLVLPVVVSPIVSGATWSLMFNHRFGPINQIIGWIWGEEVTLLWTISPSRLPGDSRSRGLAVDAVHVPAAARRPSQRG